MIKNGVFCLLTNEELVLALLARVKNELQKQKKYYNNYKGDEQDSFCLIN